MIVGYSHSAMYRPHRVGIFHRIAAENHAACRASISLFVSDPVKQKFSVFLGPDFALLRPY
jgi:hypothetical protein